MCNFRHTLGDSVKKARDEMGLTQIQLAELIGIDSRTILNIENYKGNPKMEILFPLVRALKLDPVKIFYPEIENRDNRFNELEILIAECNEDDKNSLFPICKAALEVLHCQNKIEIK